MESMLWFWVQGRTLSCDGQAVKRDWPWAMTGHGNLGCSLGPQQRAGVRGRRERCSHLGHWGHLMEMSLGQLRHALVQRLWLQV